MSKTKKWITDWIYQILDFKDREDAMCLEEIRFHEKQQHKAGIKMDIYDHNQTLSYRIIKTGQHHNTKNQEKSQNNNKKYKSEIQGGPG